MTTMKQAGLIIVVAFALIVGFAFAIGYGLASVNTLPSNQNPVNALNTTNPPAIVVPATQAPLTAGTTAATTLAPATTVDIITALNSLVADVYAARVQSVVSIKTSSSAGSGWVWDSQGHVVTNYHVIECPTCPGSVDGSITVRFSDGFEYDVTVVGYDSNADLAVLKINGAGNRQFIPLPTGDSASVAPGQIAIAIGSPFGQDFSVSQGIVSAIDRLLSSGFSNYSVGSVVQTDTALNPGNSGGPLLDIAGNVIGINTQIDAQTRQNSGVGYAVPVDLIKRVVPSLIATGSYDYSWLGISGQSIDRNLRQQAGFSDTQSGVLITDVIPNSPASTAGLRGDTGTNGQPNYNGDIIVSLSVNNRFLQVKTTEELIAFLNLYTSPGDQITIGIQRGNVELAIVATLNARQN